MVHSKYKALDKLRLVCLGFLEQPRFSKDHRLEKSLFFSIKDKMAAERAADPVINKETLLEACEAFLADKSKPTQEAYTRYIKRIFLPFMEKKDFLFSTLNVKEFRVFIRENHTKSVASVCAACIKSFLKFLQAEGYLPRPQHENIKSIKVYRENDRSDLSKEEMKACLDECRTYQETMMIKLALSSALRVSSLVKLHAD